MEIPIIEKSYPITFREEDAKKLGEHLKNGHSVDMVGMKRVGISNFLRFFLYHEGIVAAYIDKTERHLFIPVDLNDLIEREIYPFWTLTLKRIVDVVSYSDLPGLDKAKIESLFSDSIQSRDLFMLIDAVRQAMVQIVATGVFPTIFFLRFDRVKDIVTPEFFDNLQGLKDATVQKLNYVFTSFRSLDSLSPSVFTKASLSAFSPLMYIKPAIDSDMRIIYETYNKRYKFDLSAELEKALFTIVHGNVQYLQLALIILNEKKDQKFTTEKELFLTLVSDERMMLQSEELWESLTEKEKDILLTIAHGGSVTDEMKTKAPYLWDTGFVKEILGKTKVFSDLLEHYVKHKERQTVNQQEIHFSKKEHLLFTVLSEYQDQICEREKIVDAVWPEYRELGVSDWAIDRLVARVRAKLKQQKSPLEIMTIRTRGYKLTKTS